MGTNADWATQGDLSVPEFAGPGYPGWVWTTEIPEPLKTYYAGTYPLVAVKLGFASDALFNVHYEGIRADADTVSGYCTLGVGGGVWETWYASELGTVNFGKDIGSGPSQFASMTMGPTAGEAGIAENLRLQGGFDLALNTPSQVTSDGISQPRGSATYTASQANSAAVGAEAAVLTTGAFVAKNDRAYRFRFGGGVTTSVANTSTFRIRKNTAAGALVAGGILFIAAAASTQWREAMFVGRNSTGADLASYNVCLTLQASAGTSTHIGAATTPRDIHVEDIGDASNFPNAIALT